jgi:6-methylsalicylate decarboxylase
VPTDVHQHLWTQEFVEALRARRHPPALDGWTLRLDGEPDYDLDPHDHDVAARRDLAAADGVDLVLVSLSSPLGIEWLPPDEAAVLLDAYHLGAHDLPAPFASWAAACLTEVDPRRLEAELDRGCVGLQLPATAMIDGPGYERCGPLLDVLQRRRAPLFVHPGRADSGGAELPAWWAASVSYVSQMHAAWHAFLAFGRSSHPRLQVCFAMLAGLAPVHSERLAARGGPHRPVDLDAFLEISSYGGRAVDAVVRTLGVDVIVNGSDRPYAAPADVALGSALAHAIRTTNPHRLLDSKGGHRALGILAG